MKTPQERVAPAKVQSPDPALQPAAEGKSMTPPAFQLKTTDAPAAGQAPVQAKAADASKEGESKLPVAPVTQRKTPEAETVKTVAGAGPAPDPWQEFAAGFNDKFKSILNAFEPEIVPTPAAEGAAVDTTADAAKAAPVAAPPKKYGKIGEASGALMTVDQLKALFTVGQRDKLLQFFKDRVIPDRLFNGDELGSATAQQRIMMSAEILRSGVYSPGSFDQRVHARMCGHWVHITWHYAGVTPASGDLAQGVMGGFDHDNNVVLGTGKMETLWHKYKDKAKPEDLPAAFDASTGLEPIPVDSGHDKAAKDDKAKQEKDPKASSSTRMLPVMPTDQFDKIKTGDWIWYYNANGSGIGSHSVIFSRWASDWQEIDGVKYRQAICFSQGQPEWGGREHLANLGTHYFKNDKIQISPINYLARINQDAHPVSSVGELLPKSSDPKKEKKLADGNAKLITDAGKKAGHPIDPEAIKKVLREENKGHIDHLKDHLTAGQIKLFDDANASTEVETLVRLTQRLRSIVKNADINDKNRENTNEKNDASHDKIVAEMQQLDDEIKALGKDATDVEKEKADKKTAKEALDHVGELGDKQGKLKKLNIEIADVERKHKTKNKEFLTTDEAFLAKKKERDDLKLEIDGLKTSATDNKKEIGVASAEIKALDVKLAAIHKSEKDKAGKKAAAEKKLPFGLVHSGGWKGESKGGTTGKLEDVISKAELEKLPALPEKATVTP